MRNQSLEEIVFYANGSEVKAEDIENIAIDREKLVRLFLEVIANRAKLFGKEIDSQVEHAKKSLFSMRKQLTKKSIDNNR